MFLNY
jgi:hypothetical protein